MSDPDPDDVPSGQRATDWRRRDEFYAKHPEIVRARLFASGRPINRPGTDVMSPADMKNAFLYTLELGGTVSAALGAAGIDRATLRQWKERDPDFDKAMEAAEEEGTDRLEDEAYRRAFEGVEEPVFHAGEIVATVRKPSDRLMEFLLKGRRRWKYGDRVGITGGEPGDEPLKVITRVVVSPKDK